MSYRIIIPSRFSSSRLPGKPLADIAGKPMIQRVYEAAIKSSASDVIIAADDQRIVDVCEAFGAPVCVTSPEHPSGTDRLQEAASILNLKDSDVIVNVQGDEPLMPVSVIEQVADNLIQRPDVAIATLCEPITETEQLSNPNVVKTMFSATGRALYFSRSEIPHPRDDRSQQIAYRHLGIYAYRVRFLHDYVSWPEVPIEQCEKLEQLRALHFDAAMHVDIACDTIPPGVDTQADLDVVRSLFEQ
ncbi:MAG: 3-deoxy-manno-octulosonate cytidylyltransferase [Pseudomonadota bacterium]